MLDKTQYVIEQKLVALRNSYDVKDANGNLLGYVKGWGFEGMDGTPLGEIFTSGNRYEVYDAQNRLRATIFQEKMDPIKRRRGLLAIILAVMPIIVLIAFLGLLLLSPPLLVYFNTRPSAFYVIIIPCFGGTTLG